MVKPTKGSIVQTSKKQRLARLEKRITFLNFEFIGHIESYECSREGKAEIEEECNKGFEDSR
ncbi:hypothetical protein DVH24_035943 [Malus domestica]|uniref:Uncharacterized protein n=1 Tax=Malus domestica TaxID=3750 RepID=A0A498JQ55_MALDO|nr:hypothetical protein DVH24_035943 [Malus domestica]